MSAELKQYIVFDLLKDGTITNVVTSENLNGLEVMKLNRERFYQATIEQTFSDKYTNVKKVCIEPCVIKFEINDKT